MSAYSYCARPDATHGHPYLVFDCQGKLHLPLTVFAKDAHTPLAPSSVKQYLKGILPWFSWVETDSWQVQANHRWSDPPEGIREMIREYLVSRLECRVKEHPQGGEWLETTEKMLNPVRHLLAGLKHFYRIAGAHDYYPYENPLKGAFTELGEAIHQQLRDDTRSPRSKMPAQSGVDEPHRTGRLTDSYFLLKDKWIPQVITDVELPQKILNGGRMLKERGKDWGLREECLICLLFETGARISELMMLTLGDWNRRGLKDTAWTRNKGSRKRRAKYVRFSEQTVKLLKKYFDTERKVLDPHHDTLDDYICQAEQRLIDLDTIPLFLSKRGTPWTVESFRANYWKKACAAARIDADPHQARHWYTTQALIEIHERARKGKITLERGKEELIAYMHWQSGEKVLKAYNHFFQPTNHAAVQDSVFKKLRHCTAQTRRTSRRRSLKSAQAEPAVLVQPAHSAPSNSEPLHEQRQDGAALYAFLIGEGGEIDDLIADLITSD